MHSKYKLFSNSSLIKTIIRTSSSATYKSNVKFIKPLIITGILLASTNFIWAEKPSSVDAAKSTAPDEPVETTLEEDFGISQTGDSLSETARANEVRQPFSWTSAGDVLYYEINIEKFNIETNQFEPYFHHETTEEETEECMIYLEPVLAVGKYRSEIKVYNILGGLEEELTHYDEFSVHKAYKPEIKSVTYPLYLRNVMYLDDFDNDGIFEVDGHNLFLPSNDENVMERTKYFLKTGFRTIYPLSVVSHDDENNRKIRFQFDLKALDVGTYHLYAQDASGLHSEENQDSEFIVKFKKIFDLDVEAGYIFPVILHDDTLPTYLNTNLLPISGQARVTFIPFKRVWGYLGGGVRFNYSRLTRSEEFYKVDGNLAMAHLLFVYQIPLFHRRIMMELHGGPGATYFNDIQFHFNNNLDSAKLNTICFSFDAGISFQIYFNKRLYTEIAADYAFTPNTDMILGTLMPSVGIGWQF